MGLFSGLLSVGRTLISGLGGAAAKAGPTVVRAAPALAAATVGGAAFQAGTNLLTGGPTAIAQTAGTTAAQAALAVAQPQAAGAAGRFVVLQDGSRALLSSAGIPMRAQFFITAGAQLPGGAKIVSISPDGLLFGIRRAARKRTFRSELNRCKSVVKSASTLLRVLKKG